MNILSSIHKHTIAILLFLFGGSVAFGISLPPGVTVIKDTETALILNFTPVIEDRIPDATINSLSTRWCRDGVIELSYSLPIALPSPDGFLLQDVIVKSVQSTGDVALPKSPIPAPYLTETPQDNWVTLEYDGIARDLHVGRLRVVVGRYSGNVMTYPEAIQVTVVFVPHKSVARGTTVLENVSMAINKTGERLWRMPQQHLRQIAVRNTELNDSGDRLDKMGEQTQSTEAFDKAWMIRITELGLYRISADELRRNGISTDATAASSIRLFSTGGQPISDDQSAPLSSLIPEQPLVVNTNSDGSIKEVIFFGSPERGFNAGRNNSLPSRYINPFATESTYLLTMGGSGLRAYPRQPLPGDRAVLTTYAWSRQLFEEDQVNAFKLGSGRRWFGRPFEQSLPKTIPMLLPDLVRTDSVTYVTSFGGRAVRRGVMTVSENGKVIFQENVDSNGFYMDSWVTRRLYSISTTEIAPDGRSVLKYSYSSNDNNGVGFVDFIEYHYPRDLQARNNEISFWTGLKFRDSSVLSYDIQSLGSNVIAFDITDPASPELIPNTSNTGGIFNLRISNAESRHIFLSSSPRSASLTPAPWGNYKGNQRKADVIVITHRDLLPSASAYAEYREKSSGLKTIAVPTDEVYAEFGAGMPDPTAIRVFLRHTFLEWEHQPRYVVLWGDGHFDYRNISTAAPMFVPTYQNDEPDRNTWGLGTRSVEDYFVLLVGDDIRPDMALGRIPINSNSEGFKMLSKIREYESSQSVDSWRSRITMVADDGYVTNQRPEGDLHLSQSERLGNGLHPTLQQRKLYLVEYPTTSAASGRAKPGVNRDLVSSTNTQGHLLLNWIGHGNPRVWAHEGVFVQEVTVPQMTNRNKMFFLTAATCDFSRFDMAETQSGAEDLVTWSEGGAIGVFSASRVVLSGDNLLITERFYSELFKRNANGDFPRLGDVMWAVKQHFVSENDQKYLLLGDPTLRLLIPRDSVVFESINDMSFTDSTIPTVKALSEVEIKGFITNGKSNDPDTTFNGTITINLYDSDVKLEIKDFDGSVHRFRRNGAALNRSSYQVVNGRFVAVFVVPQDISFLGIPGALFGFAASNDHRFAMGVTRSIKVNEVDQSGYSDINGPQIDIYMDSRRFMSGDKVRPDPILIVDLEDATGVNTTGIGVGHNLEAHFNNGQLIENLTEAFETSPTNSKAGSVRRQVFGLADGLHTVRVRAWDVLNNYSERTTLFRINRSSGPSASSLVNFPNPFTSSTLITFKHTLSHPSPAVLSIYDINGRRVYRSNFRLEMLQTAEVSWDGTDSVGNRLPTGVYNCIVSIEVEGGTPVTVSGQIMLIR